MNPLVVHLENNDDEEFHGEAREVICSQALEDTSALVLTGRNEIILVLEGEDGEDDDMIILGHGLKILEAYERVIAQLKTYIN